MNLETRETYSAPDCLWHIVGIKCSYTVFFFSQLFIWFFVHFSQWSDNWQFLVSRLYSVNTVIAIRSDIGICFRLIVFCLTMHFWVLWEKLTILLVFLFGVKFPLTSCIRLFHKDWVKFVARIISGLVIIKTEIVVNWIKPGEIFPLQ